MRRFAVFVPLALFAAFAVALDRGLDRDPSVIPSVLIDKPLPVFALAPIGSGGKGFGRADLAGRVSLVNIFASWCTVCAAEHPTLMALSNEKAVPIYGVDWKDAPADGKDWLEKNGNPYARAGSDENGRLAIDLGVTGAPETFVVDKTGRIRYKQIGAITAEVWQGKLAPLVAKLEAEP
jgi:cytochrome c biogenesis protein CcmG/thiol:disulfide interchange protein DsbE